MEVRWRGCGLGTHDVMLLNEACLYLSFVVFGNYNRLSTVRFDGEIWRGSKIFRFTSKNYLYDNTKYALDVITMFLEESSF